MQNKKCVFSGYDGNCRALYTSGGRRIESFQRDCTNCLFFKTQEQYKMGQEKSFVRINSLSSAQQSKISKSYYRGHMPWIIYLKKLKKGENSL